MRHGISNCVGYSGVGRLSILYLRCPRLAAKRAVYMIAPFNSLFEMLSSWGILQSPPIPAVLSILYLRCMSFDFIETAKIIIPDFQFSI